MPPRCRPIYALVSALIGVLISAPLYALIPVWSTNLPDYVVLTYTPTSPACVSSPRVCAGGRRGHGGAHQRAPVRAPPGAGVRQGRRGGPGPRRAAEKVRMRIRALFHPSLAPPPRVDCGMCAAPSHLTLFCRGVRCAVSCRAKVDEGAIKAEKRRRTIGDGAGTSEMGSAGVGHDDI